MKKILKMTALLFTLAAVFALCLTGCSGEPSESGGEPAQSNVAETASPSPEPEEGENGAGNLGDYTVEILSARKSTDYEGKDAIVIRYSFTNNSDDATSFMFATQSKAFQDGVELEMAVLMDDDTYNSQDLTKEIKTGASIEVEKAFVLDSDSPVEAEVSELVSFDDEQKVEKTFDLATL